MTRSPFGSKQAYPAALRATGCDGLVADPFHEGSQLAAPEVDCLKIKVSGGARQVICYMSIGEAEAYRYCRRSVWKPGDPGFLDKENPDREGDYKVRYWDPLWQTIIYGNDASYLKRILDTRFDGVYLDMIDALECFEEEYGG